MEFLLFPKSLTARALAAFAALGLPLQPNCQAVLTVDVRAVSVSPGFGTVAGGKTVILNPNAVGVDVGFEIWAVIRGDFGFGADSRLSGLYGSLVSSPGTVTNRDPGVAGNQALPATPNTIKGNLSNTLIAPWNAAFEANSGGFVDLDGDGDLDVGSTNFSLSFSSYVGANANGSQDGAGLAPANFHQLSDGREFKISTAIFRVTAVQAGGATAVNWVFPSLSFAEELARASFFSAGVTKDGADANLAVSAPVRINVVPEPAAAGLMGLGLLALAARRRSR